MPLNPAGLIAEFAKVFASNPPTALKSAQAIAKAYDTYAKAAMAVGAVPAALVAPGDASAMIPILVAGMAPVPVPMKFGIACAAAISAYWLTAKFVGPPVAPSPAPTVSAAVVLVPPGPLAAVLLVPVPVPAAAAAQLGIACDAYTRTGLVMTNYGPFSLQ